MPNHIESGTLQFDGDEPGYYLNKISALNLAAIINIHICDIASTTAREVLQSFIDDMFRLADKDEKIDTFVAVAFIKKG